MSILEMKDWYLQGFALFAAILIAWVFYRLGRPKGKALAYFADGQNVIDQSRPSAVTNNVAFMFNGEPIPRLAVCQINIWGAGDAHVTSSDIATRDTLHIGLASEGRVLEANVEEADPACAVSLLIDPASRSRVNVGFDFLNPGHRIQIRILHTSQTPTVRLRGQIIGGQLIDVRTAERTRIMKRVWTSIAVVIAVIVFAAIYLRGGTPNQTALLLLVLMATVVSWALYINVLLRASPLTRLRLRITGLTPPEPHA